MLTDLRRHRSKQSRKNIVKLDVGNVFVQLFVHWLVDRLVLLQTVLEVATSFLWIHLRVV